MNFQNSQNFWCREEIVSLDLITGMHDEVLYPRGHLSDEMIFPIDSCRGCGRIIFSSSKYSTKESDEKCDCDFTDEDDYGFCIDCGLPIQY